MDQSSTRSFNVGIKQLFPFTFIYVHPEAGCETQSKVLVVYSRGERNTCRKWGGNTVKRKQSISDMPLGQQWQWVTRVQFYGEALENGANPTQNYDI